MNHDDSQLLLCIDGECSLCNRLAALVENRRRGGREFAYIPLQSAECQGLLRQYGVVAGGLESMLVLRDGVVYRQAEAVIQVLQQMKQPWPAAARLLRFLPSRLTTFLYKLVARNRYRLCGRAAACGIIPARESGDKPS